MLGGAPTLACPECRAELVPERTRMNVVVEYCPKEHGIFLDPSDISQLVDGKTQTAIRDLAKASQRSEGYCPRCRAALREAELNHLVARGCPDCGSLWFDNQVLKNHVLEVRKRAYGEGSMAARADVMRDAAAFYPIEVAAGILTEFQLEHEL